MITFVINNFYNMENRGRKKKTTKKRKFKRNSKASRKLSPTVQQYVYENGIEVHELHNKAKFVKGNLFINHGYDLLEYWVVVSRYVCVKHGITSPELDYFLYLGAKEQFTYHEYVIMPKHGKAMRLRTMIERGFVRKFNENKKPMDALYVLSSKGKRIIKDTYMYLSGEKKMPEEQNVLLKTGNSVDKKRVDLIAKFNSLEVPETKKRFHGLGRK